MLRVARDFLAHRAPARAAALSYTTILALVPLLALVLSISKAVLHDAEPQTLEQAVEKTLAYAVPQLNTMREVDEIRELRQQVFEQIDAAIGNINAGALGFFGSVILIAVAISLLSSIEHALNDVWGVSQSRTFGQRIIFYWTGLTLGPIVLFFAFGFTSSTVVSQVLGVLPREVSGVFWFLLPFLILSTGFTLLYWVMPNTQVPFFAAGAGGVTAGVLFQLNNLASAVYLSRVVSYSKVYGSIGAVPILMVGLYFSWLIVLLGAEVAQSVAEPSTESTDEPDDFQSRLRLSLDVARQATAAYLAGRGGATNVEIAANLDISLERVNRTLGELVAMAILVRTERSGDGTPRYLPARPPETVPALEVVDAVRSGPEGNGVAPEQDDSPVGRFLRELRTVERKALASVTLASLAETELASPGSTSA